MKLAITKAKTLQVGVPARFLNFGNMNFLYAQ